MTGKQAAEAGWRNLKHYRVPAAFVLLGAAAALLASVYRDLPDQTTLAGWCSAAWGAYLVYAEKRQSRTAAELGDAVSERIFERLGGVNERLGAVERRLDRQEQGLLSVQGKIETLLHAK